MLTTSFNYKKIVVFLIFLLFIVLDYSLIFLGPETGLSLCIVYYIFLLTRKNISSFQGAFIFGLFIDLLFVISPFGFFTFTFIILALLFILLNKNVPNFMIGIIFYLILIIVFNLLFAQVTLILIFKSILFYLIIGIFSFFVFSK
ncbi:hypothetical protein COV24_04425 [candidate division WWE3 bacterium CG10_big_fil_rev_8_21_14_0_10_32_10]|uniref:Rod shape-determining protein MreD n=1 Tax=candidate division WWE3 bacterium CG10_big_fil_rev_8_21_14_0_10_32_10 TaxID=1975090 RepID=A0A2H0R9C5_UNCKA|nr:MAG: hypothetical protein COV24_04425 [candidate division WWE3 bacterium CG10_big_fil_rev_8_21_14_0_10_32_10]